MILPIIESCDVMPHLLSLDQPNRMRYFSDLMSGHVDPKVNDDFENWLNEMHGNYSKVKSVRGPTHDFLGVIYDFSEPGKVKLGMIDYIQQMLDDFSVSFDEKDKGC